MRSTVDSSLPTTDPIRYEADFVAYGPDLVIRKEAFNLRAYYYVSSERFVGGPTPELERKGFTVEPSVTWQPNPTKATRVSVLARYSVADEQRLIAGSGSSVITEDLQRVQYGVGLHVAPTNTLMLNLGYMVQDEKKALAPTVTGEICCEDEVILPNPTVDIFPGRVAAILGCELIS